AASPPAVPARPPQPAASRTPAPGGVGEAQLRALYEAYVAAKKQCNEDVSRLTYEAVARSVAKQVPELMTRFKARSVDFKVEVKDGRAVLKAIPKV
ncbi:MXAN_5187 C-terminal domain-containing protein, partial [Anaeromyxobacter sp. SG26]